MQLTQRHTSHTICAFSSSLYLHLFSVQPTDTNTAHSYLLAAVSPVCTRNMCSALPSHHTGTATPLQPGQALRVAASSGYQTSRQLAHKGGKVVSPTNRPGRLYPLAYPVGGFAGFNPPPPRNSEVLKKLGQFPSSVEYNR
jgi:hypothetical protein